MRDVRAGKIILSESVNKLMGPASDRVFQHWDSAYHLGRDNSYFAIDSKWLVIRVDERSGQVLDAKVIVD